MSCSSAAVLSLVVAGTSQHSHAWGCFDLYRAAPGHSCYLMQMASITPHVRWDAERGGGGGAGCIPTQQSVDPHLMLLPLLFGESLSNLLL
jgi:hypothetical protein